MSLSPKTERRADIDVLRAAAVMLVLAVHTAQVYSPWQSWHVQNAERSKLLAEGMLLVGPWVMPLFMMLAGRSVFFSLRHRSERAFMRERILRLFLPLVLGSLLLVPPQVYVHRIVDGDFTGSFLEFYPRFFDGLYPQGNLSWGHLWFIAYLLMYSTLLLPLVVSLGRRVVRTQPRWSGQRLVLLGVPLAAAQILLRARYPQNNALLHDWANHAQLLPAFIFGYLLSADPALEACVDRLRRKAWVAGGLASSVLAVYAWPGDFAVRLPSRWSLEYVAFWVVFVVATWAWLIAIVAEAKRRVRSGSPALDWARRAAYPTYILHQTVIVLIAWRVVRARLPIGVEYVLLLVLATAVTVGTYEVLRRFPPGRWLLGLRPQGREPSPIRIQPTSGR